MGYHKGRVKDSRRMSGGEEPAVATDAGEAGDADPMNTLGISLSAQVRNENEMVRLMRRKLNAKASGGGASGPGGAGTTVGVRLEDLFDGFRPRWAGEALLRLEVKGMVEQEQDEGGRVRWKLTWLGQRAHVGN